MGYPFITLVENGPEVQASLNRQATPRNVFWSPTLSRQVPNLANARVSTVYRKFSVHDFFKKEDTIL